MRAGIKPKMTGYEVQWNGCVAVIATSLVCLRANHFSLEPNSAQSVRKNSKAPTFRCC
jgi:hypothetical protein